MGLSNPELHIARVQARVRRGGHDIPAHDIHRRYEHSRLNLIVLLPYLTTLCMYDNSTDAAPSAGRTRKLKPVLHMEQGKILGPTDLTCTPNWAKPIVAAALKLNQFISPFDHRSRSTGISQPRDMDSCVSVRIGYLDGLKVSYLAFSGTQLRRKHAFDSAQETQPLALFAPRVSLRYNPPLLGIAYGYS